MTRELMFIGKNPDFKVSWSISLQTYFVYKNDKLIIKLFRFSEVKNYLR